MHCVRRGLHRGCTTLVPLQPMEKTAPLFLCALPKTSAMSRKHVTAKDLEAFKKDLVDTLQQTPITTQLPRWVKSWHVMQMLGISKGKLRHMRERGEIPYVKIGGLMFYEL